MKIRSLAIAGLFVLSVFANARATSFADIQSWTGSGTNQAAMVINWTDGTTSESMVWGYRWDGTSTGEQMLYAIMAGDPQLYAEVSGTTAYGTALFGIGFNQSSSQPFALTPGLSFDNAHLAYADYGTVDDSRTSVNPGDLWQEGWNSGYWSYYVSTESRVSADFTDWDYSGVGMTGRELADGDWDGWVFAPGFSSSTPAIPDAISPVPEPSTWAMLILGGTFLIILKTNQSKKCA